MKKYALLSVFFMLAAGLLYYSNIAIAQDKAAAETKPLTKAEVEAIVKQYIIDNPGLIIASVENYQKKKMAEDAEKASKNVIALEGDLQNDSFSPSIGNPKGDVTIVEFFDYHCGYCKQFLPTITNEITKDPELKVVFKEFPILSEDSVLASRASLAVNSIDKTKYLPFHMALMKMSKAFTEENLTEKAKEVGISAAALKKAMENPEIDKELAKNADLAHALSVHGTPALVVGTEVVPGVIPADALEAKIAAARSKNKK